MTKQSTNTLQQSLQALIADDAYAMAFQSLPQYRTALLQRLAALAREPAQEQAEPTTAELAHALRQAERLLRASGFAMTGTASSQIVAAIAQHATSAQQDPVAAPQQAAAPCKHAKCTAYYAHIECLDCSRVKTDSGWGIASNQWFKSEEEAKFYRCNGRLPQVERATQLHGGQGEVN